MTAIQPDIRTLRLPVLSLGRLRAALVLELSALTHDMAARGADDMAARGAVDPGSRRRAAAQVLDRADADRTRALAHRLGGL